jgi:hypothetical protein
MQAELRLQRPDLLIEIHGVNQAGHESGNAQACAGRVIPWLQDTWTDNVWGSWQVTFRDVVVLDDENKTVDIFNLTTHTLAVSEDYEELKAILVAAAGG